MTDPTEFIKNFEKFLAEPTDKELNKRIHEIMGLCWHKCECKNNEGSHFCIHCKNEYFDFESSQYVYINSPKYNFLTWEGFGILWEWIQNHPGWYSFWHKYWHTNLISPRALSEAMVEFFKEEVAK